MESNQVVVRVNEIVSGFGTKWKKEAIVEVYNQMAAEGHKVSILNEKYPVVDGVRFQLRAKNGRLTAAEW